MTTTEPSIEQCLEELREMFPRETLQVDASAWHWSKDGVAETETDARVTVGFDTWKTFYAPTLSEAMAQVRAWYANQSSSTPGER